MAERRPKNVADLGANIGLHSLIMDKCGFSINSFEPDPIHVGVFQEKITRVLYLKSSRLSSSHT